MGFFSSDLVQKELEEIKKLQEIVYNNVFKFNDMCKNDKLKHIETLEELLNKQKVLYTRLSLSDDPEAQDVKTHIESSAVMMGMPEGMDMNLVFNNISTVIQNMKIQLELA